MLHVFWETGQTLMRCRHGLQAKFNYSWPVLGGGNSELAPNHLLDDVEISFLLVGRILHIQNVRYEVNYFRTQLVGADSQLG